MTDDLSGRVAMVTGAARGQGRSHAVHLAERGADLVICDIGDDIRTVPYSLAGSAEIEETQHLVEQTGRRCKSAIVDVRSSTEVNAFVRDSVAEFGRIDILLANAGVCSFAQFAQLTDEQWQDVIGVNLTGVFNSMRAVVPHMIDLGYGRIVATSSMAGLNGVPNLAHYAAAKWGVIALVKTLALEVATHAITVNAICPYTVDTAMVQNPAFYGLFAPDIANPTKEEIRSRYGAMSPMGVPWIEPADVSSAIGYLVSEQARFVSGSTLEVTAGCSATMH